MNITTKDSKFISAGELGDILGVTANTIRQWAKDGKIPALALPSGRFLFDVKEVTTTLSQNNGRKNGAS